MDFQKRHLNVAAIQQHNNQLVQVQQLILTSEKKLMNTVSYVRFADVKKMTRIAQFHGFVRNSIAPHPVSYTPDGRNLFAIYLVSIRNIHCIYS